MSNVELSSKISPKTAFNSRHKLGEGMIFDFMKEGGTK
ncbi:hypothetical protein CHCC20335_0743 [Bacillus paralicheniformis]|nr:hypothetical protein CHCC20335_0743 [Bacillus paralicheniformis]